MTETDEKKLNKQCTDLLQKIEVSFFINQNQPIADDIKANILTHVKNLGGSELREIYICIRLSDTHHVTLSKNWGVSYELTLSTPGGTFDNYIYKGRAFDDFSTINDNELFDDTKKFFSIGTLSEKELGEKITDFKYLMMNIAYKDRSYGSGDFNIEIPKSLQTKIMEQFTVLPEMVEYFKAKKGKTQNLWFIMDVIESNVKQARWVLMFGGSGQKRFRLSYVKTIDYIYNYMDKYRTVFMDSYCHEWLAFDVMTENEFENYDNLYGDYQRYITSIQAVEDNEDLWNIFIDNDSLVSSRTKFLLEEKKKQREKAIIAQKNLVWKNKIDNIGEKPLVKNDISFSKYSMEYEHIKLDTNESYDFSKYLTEIGVDTISDFNTIFNRAIKSIINVWTHRFIDMPYDVRRATDTTFITTKITNIKINKLKFVIDKKNLRITKNGSYYKINDIRINKNELADCISHVLCYGNIEDYETFLKSVSSCSLKFHNAIVNGVKKTYYLNGEHITLEFKIERKKNLNYLISGDSKFKINNTNKFIDADIGNYGGYDKLIFLLLSVSSVKIENMGGFLSDAQKRYLLAIEKADKLFKRTCEQFEVIQERISDKSGWTVKGKSGSKYLIVEKGNNDYGIYKVISEDRLDYVCIVDRSAKNQVGKDKLVSRIYALANDSLIANQISTLRV